jgi:hypothetical protein
MLSSLNSNFYLYSMAAMWLENKEESARFRGLIGSLKPWS